MQPASRTPRRRIPWIAASVLAILLIAPVLALIRLDPWFDWRILVAAPIAISFITFFAYRSDKLRAEAGERRIPETTLHLFALLGGWPGAFLAQRMFRHKVSKVSFQLTFWAVVLLHEFVAIDFLQHWRISTDVYRVIEAQMGRR
jgi:uncharacterized membrane protein YsdA (DUF1294 family)